MKKRLLLLIFLLTPVLLRAMEPADTLPPLTGNWIDQLIRARFDINDPRIRYPKFPNFCRKVYNWGDRTFNSFDTAYVVGTGKKWKVMLNASNWMQGYGYLFDLTNGRNHADRVIVHSNVNSDIGISLNFMAVGIGHTWNVNQLLHKSTSPRSAWNFNFTCALFSAELQTLSTKGNAYVRQFGRYNDGHKVHIPFDNVKQDMLAVQAYYFFNHRRYSQAAAYTFSKYQLRSSGTWLLGLKYSNQDISLDFQNLDPEVLAFKPDSLTLQSRFHFHEFALTGGYAYNAVMPHNWLFNITLAPSFGYRRSMMSGERKFAEMVTIGGIGRMALTYNHRALFCSLQGSGNASLVFDSNYSFFASRYGISLIVGARF